MIRRRSGAPRRDLREKHAKHSRLPLRLVHVTAAGFGREILLAGQLEPRACPVFPGRPLLYCFVSRPAYRLKGGAEKSWQVNRFPFALLLKPDVLPAPHHVYPFDTGGAAAGVFTRADPVVPLEDYELLPDLQAAAAHIEWAFGTNAAYLDGRLRPDLEASVPHFDTVARGFLDIAAMATSGWNDSPDDRASAVEVAYSGNIALRGSVELAVLPKQFLEDKGATNLELLRAIRDNDIEFVTYDWQPNRAPNDLKRDIDELVRAHYAEKGML